MVSLSTLVLALSYLAWRRLPLRLPLFLLTAAATLLVDMATTAFNSFFDKWRGLDEKTSNLEADKVLVHEDVPALAAFFVGLGLFAAAALLGVFIAAQAGFWVVVAGTSSMIVGFLYSGGPLPISRTPLGELVAGGFLGSLLFLIVFRVIAGFWDGSAFLASLPGAAMIGSILAVNNACDRVEDRAGGRLTLAVILGARASALPLALLLGLGFLFIPALCAFGLLPWTAAAGAGLSLPLAARQLFAMGKRGLSRGTKSANMGAIVKILLGWSLGLAAGLLFPLVLR